MKKKVIKISKIVLIVYCLVGIGLYHFQEKFLFHPEPVDVDFKYNFKGRTEEAFIPVNKYEQIHLVKFRPDTPSRGLILYFHGNMKNVSWYESSARFFTQLGFEVWMHDYPGFGKTTGKLSEDKLYQHAMQVRKLAGEKFSSDSIYLYGRSLGTGIAAYMAANSENRSLILETPYSSIPSLFSHYAFMYPVGRMSIFKIPTSQFLEDVKEPILILHGTKDRVIPLSEASKLRKVLKPGDKFIEIEGGGHNDLGSNEKYKRALQQWLKNP
ncbi:MAG: alpha/beta fold hydrolase [Chitinophagaceae bacterium]|nr:MAG: alpha/beta fold hydrolase [Chitinophagaceae bacterium]